MERRKTDNTNVLNFMKKVHESEANKILAFDTFKSAFDELKRLARAWGISDMSDEDAREILSGYSLNPGVDIFMSKARLIEVDKLKAAFEGGEKGINNLANELGIELDADAIKDIIEIFGETMLHDDDDVPGVPGEGGVLGPPGEGWLS
jgi:hypothetical protein